MIYGKCLINFKLLNSLFTNKVRLWYENVVMRFFDSLKLHDLKYETVSYVKQHFTSIFFSNKNTLNIQLIKQKNL